MDNIRSETSGVVCYFAYIVEFAGCVQSLSSSFCMNLVASCYIHFYEALTVLNWMMDDLLALTPSCQVELCMHACMFTMLGFFVYVVDIYRVKWEPTSP